jgi:hypothetical protein
MCLDAIWPDWSVRGLRERPARSSRRLLGETLVNGCQPPEPRAAPPSDRRLRGAEKTSGMDAASPNTGRAAGCRQRQTARNERQPAGCERNRRRRRKDARPRRGSSSDRGRAAGSRSGAGGREQPGRSRHDAAKKKCAGRMPEPRFTNRRGFRARFTPSTLASRARLRASVRPATAVRVRVAAPIVAAAAAAANPAPPASGKDLRQAAAVRKIFAAVRSSSLRVFLAAVRQAEIALVCTPRSSIRRARKRKRACQDRQSRLYVFADVTRCYDPRLNFAVRSSILRA